MVARKGHRVANHRRVQQQTKWTGRENEQDPWREDENVANAEETTEEVLAIRDQSCGVQNKPHSER